MSNRGRCHTITQQNSIRVDRRKCQRNECIGGKPGVPDPERVEIMLLRGFSVVDHIGHWLGRIDAGHDAELSHRAFSRIEMSGTYPPATDATRPAQSEAV